MRASTKYPSHRAPLSGFIWRFAGLSTGATTGEVIGARTAFGNVARWMRTTTFARLAKKMAVDPANPDVVYVGTPENGVFVTTDGGATQESASKKMSNSQDIQASLLIKARGLLGEGHRIRLMSLTMGTACIKAMTVG